MSRQIIVAALVCLASPLTSAAVSLITNEAAFGTNDTIQWTQFGPRGASIPGFVTGNSIAGRGFWAESYSSDFSGLGRVDQWGGPPADFTGWAGNFAAGESLLSVTGQDLVTPPTTDAHLTLNFNEAIQGFGSQFDANFSSSWMMHIQAFDAEDSLLGLFDLSMKRSNGGIGDGTAKFMGIRSDSVNITRVEIWATAIYSTDFGPIIAPDYFAMNFGRLVVPAPGTLLLGIAAAAVATRRSRRR